ncbi:MAG: hypothetical protein GAK29_03055 [Acinetobacter bereziniae]|uniref:Wzy n=1 Tax=Acinetobacter bereziniae TaxID=106648 RepID=A0A833UTF5_ACIBZ|nr:MAG: hypothetical protein GAK29_03055 [Acinetobacter bereziniae]
MSMRKIHINPFYLLVVFYLIINFIYAIIGFYDGKMEIEFQYKIIDKASFIYAFLFQLISIFLIVMAYMVASIKHKPKKIFEYSDKIAFFLLIGQILYFIVNVIYNANIAGSSKVFSGNPLLNIFFILLPFDILFFILSISLKSKRLFLLNSLIYLVSNLSRGWMGAPLLLLFAILCRNDGFYLSGRSFLKILVLIILFSLVCPYLLEMKWVIRGDYDLIDVIVNVNNYGYERYFFEAINYVFNRFQHVGHIALIIDNRDYLAIKYNNMDNMVPYWAEGLIQSIFMNIAHIDGYLTFSRFVTMYLFKISLAQSWTTNIGMASWFFILGYKVIFYILYLLLIIFIPFLFVAKYANKQIFLMLSVFTVFYLFHGWFYAYLTFCTYAMIIVLLSKLKI